MSTNDQPTPVLSQPNGIWQENELCHRQMLRAIPVVVYSCDAEGRITFYNLAAARLFRREPRLNHDFWHESWRLFRPDGTPLSLEDTTMAVVLREGCPVRGEVMLVEQADGTRLRLLPTSEPILNRAGAVVGTVNMLVEMPEFRIHENAASAV